MSIAHEPYLLRETPAVVLAGARNKSLFRIACGLRRQGLGSTALADNLLRENQLRCVPPLPEGEVLAIARSVERYEMGDPDRAARTSRPQPAPAAALKPAIEPPPPLWQDRARAFLTYSQDRLAASPMAMAYVTGRGLGEETIRVAGLGYNPHDVRDCPEKWGLSGKPVWLPQGWVIPNESADVLWGLTIRRSEGYEPKYVGPRGSRRKLYGLDRIGHHSDLIIVEGEFDAMLLWQEVRPIASVVGLGGAQNISQLGTTPVLAGFRRWWTATDYDAAGKEADEAIRALTARARRLSMPIEGCKDPTDLWRAGADLAEWLVSQIGPTNVQEWLAWAERRLDELDDGTLCSVSDLTDRRLRQWLALHYQYLARWRGAVPHADRATSSAGS